jgi:hypothetical protein
VFAKGDGSCIPCSTAQRECVVTRPILLSAPAAMLTWDALCFKEGVATLQMPRYVYRVGGPAKLSSDVLTQRYHLGGASESSSIVEWRATTASNPSEYHHSETGYRTCQSVVYQHNRVEKVAIA